MNRTEARLALPTRSTILYNAESYGCKLRPSVQRAIFLLALFAPSLLLGQAFHLLLVNLDLSRLFHALTQIRHEQAKQLGLLGLHQRIANLILLGGEVRVGR